MKNGITQNLLEKLKKLTVFSIAYDKNYYSATDTYIFCKLLTVCSQFHLSNMMIELRADVSSNNIKLVDRKKLSAIILECCAISAASRGVIKIQDDCDNLYILYSGNITKSLKILIKSADALHFKIKNGRLGTIVLPYTNTNKKAEKITGGIDMLLDPLSLIKIFLSDINR